MSSTVLFPGNARRLLQTSQLATDCRQVTCLLFNVLAISSAVIVVVVILMLVLVKRWKYQRAVSRGSVPATMLISQRFKLAEERGELEKFCFKVHRPKSRKDINEEACPICLKERPKKASWVVFGCQHATCDKCFKQLVSLQHLHSICPICRDLLATGDGNRGGTAEKRAEMMDRSVSSTTTTTTTTTLSSASSGESTVSPPPVVSTV